MNKILNRKINIARIVWVTGVFLILIIILLLVMNYKINYQYLEKNYLYFYECEEELCVTRIKDKEKLLFSTYKCEYEECPEYKKIISDDYALLEAETGNILYNYKTGKIISKNYDDYELINNEFIITKKNNLYGIITNNGEQIVNLTYTEIGIHSNGILSGYNAEKIIVKKNDKYGIISYKTGKVIEELKYTDKELSNLLIMIKE